MSDENNFLKRKLESLDDSGSAREDSNSSSYYSSSSSESTSDNDSSESDNESLNAPFSAVGSGYGIGASLLQKMGFKIGTGLGINNQGIKEPVHVDLNLKKGAGIGMHSIAMKKQYHEEDIIVLSDEDEKEVTLQNTPVVFDKHVKMTFSERQKLLQDDLVSVRKELEILGVDSNTLEDLCAKGIVEMKKYLLKQKILMKRKTVPSLPAVAVSESYKNDSELQQYQTKLFEVQKIKAWVLKVKNQGFSDVAEVSECFESLNYSLFREEYDSIIANIGFELKDSLNCDVEFIELFCRYVFQHVDEINDFEKTRALIFALFYSEFCVEQFNRYKTAANLVLQSEQNDIFQAIEKLPELHVAYCIQKSLNLNDSEINSSVLHQNMEIISHIKGTCNINTIFAKENITIFCGFLKSATENCSNSKSISSFISQAISLAETLLKQAKFEQQLSNQQLLSISQLLTTLKAIIGSENIEKNKQLQVIEDNLYYECILKPHYYQIKDLDMFMSLIEFLDTDLKANIIAEYLSSLQQDQFSILDLLVDQFELGPIEYKKAFSKLQKLSKIKAERSKDRPITVTSKQELIHACNKQGYILDKVTKDDFNGPVYIITNPDNGLSETLILEKNMICELTSSGEVHPVTSNFKDIIKKLTYEI